MEGQTPCWTMLVRPSNCLALTSTNWKIMSITWNRLDLPTKRLFSQSAKTMSYSSHNRTLETRRRGRSISPTTCHHWSLCRKVGHNICLAVFLIFVVSVNTVLFIPVKSGPQVYKVMVDKVTTCSRLQSETFTVRRSVH